MQKGGIRFEDLGEPVQKLLRNLKGGYNDEDMALLEYVSVKDMARIYQDMASNTYVETIWQELRETLLARREKAERQQRELEARQASLDDDRNAADQAEHDAEAERIAAEEAAEAKRKRKEEKRRRKLEAAMAEAEADEQARLEEEARAAAEREEEEARARAEEERRLRKQRKKEREERRRQQAEEEERLREELERVKLEAKQRRKGQKRDWEDYVANHPLEFAKEQTEIQQVHVERESKAPPAASTSLLSRSYTPQCPNCHAKYAKPPSEWDCPVCLRRLRQKIKCWQPDHDATSCGVCNGTVGRFSRHHCRNCGRVVCGKCSSYKASIPMVGFKEPVRVCETCMSEKGKAQAKQ